MTNINHRRHEVSTQKGSLQSPTFSLGARVYLAGSGFPDADRSVGAPRRDHFRPVLGLRVFMIAWPLTPEHNHLRHPLSGRG